MLLRGSAHALILAALGAALPVAGCGGCSEDVPAAGGDGGATGDGGADDDGGSSGRDASSIPGVRAIRVEPASVRLVTDGLTAAIQTFTVIADRDDGTTEDVTTRVGLQLSPPTLGALSGATFTSALTGGRGAVAATLGTLRAEAAITVVLERTIAQPPPGGAPLPPDPTGLFTRGPVDPSRAPELVYPNDGVLLPPNLGSVEVHYHPGPSNTLFEVTLTSPVLALTIHTRCEALADGCLFTVGGDLWASLAAAEGGGDPITVRVRGTDDAGSGVGASAELRVSLSLSPVQGGLYYWTTSNGTGIMRTEFGAPTPPERFFPFQGGGCYGCHALSRNGQRMVLSQNGQWDGRMTLVDVASQNILLSPDRGEREQFQTWSPASDRFAGIYGDDDPPDTNLRIRSGDDGRVLESIAIGNEITHPDWSPSGDRIAFTWVTYHETSQRPGRGGISFVTAEPAGGWSGPQALIPPEDGKNFYYPAYTPDGQLVIFNESTCPNGQVYDGSCDGDADPSAVFWVIPAAGGTRVRLDRANAPGVADRGNTTLSSTFPKWAPFVDPRARTGTKRVLWFTFSSRRMYGLRAPSGSNQLLWMAAVDPDELLAGRDGSFAAFALPFQDLATSNHIAQWTTRIVPSSPDGGLGDSGPIDPAGDGGTSSCLAAGDPCDPNAADCCAGNVCTMNGPGIYLCRPNL